MKLEEVHRKTGHSPDARSDLKQVTRNWLGSMHQNYPIALTLTLKQDIVEKTPIGIRKRSLTRQDAVKIAERFKMKLDREVFGIRKAGRLGHTLKYIPVLEGVDIGKRMHLHFAIGGFPNYKLMNKIDTLVSTAKSHVENIDKQYNIQIADSGWFEYITKEIKAKDTDNILWHLC